jgi:hypothetical protein
MLGVSRTFVLKTCISFAISPPIDGISAPLKDKSGRLYITPETGNRPQIIQYDTEDRVDIDRSWLEVLLYPACNVVHYFSSLTCVTMTAEVSTVVL